MIEREDRAEGSVLRVSGRLDAAHAAPFGERLLALLADPAAPTVLDLSGVEFLSSGGLRVLLQAARFLQPQGGRLTLIHVPEAVRAVLTLSGFGTFMTITTD